jgi:hypothetical protein
MIMSHDEWISLCIALAVAGLAGCLGGEDSRPDEARPTTNRSAELVATVALSDTHVVQFWDYGHGDAMIDERLNIDLDRDTPIRLADLDMPGKTLTDVYLALARDGGELAATARLGELDARVLARARATVVTPEMEALIQADLRGGAAGTSPDRAPPQPQSDDDAPAGLGVVRSEVACAEPAWDWVGDVGWFKNNFCGADSVFCPTEVTWASYGWYRGPSWFKATGFAQSHCAGASWLFERRAYGGFPSYGIADTTLADFVLAPRTLDTQWWTTTGDRAWYAKVTSVTGENRTGLAIHHN